MSDLAEWAERRHLFRQYERGECYEDGYPIHWLDVARAIKDIAGNKCERCGALNSRKNHRVLTVHHLNGIPSDCRRENLCALCQVCHLRVQSSGWGHPNYPLGQLPLFGESDP
jgi:hypothetical protein